MPTAFYTALFWIYWGITVAFGGLLAAAVIRERDRGTKALAAMLLVPVVLRILLVK